MKDSILMQFLTSIAAATKSLEELKKKAAQKKCFTNVETNFWVVERWNRNPEVSIGIDADLAEAINDDYHSAGLSLSIIKRDEKWVMFGEAGWSSYNIGFVPVESMEKDYKDIVSLLSDVSTQFTFLKAKYEGLLEEYERSYQQD